MAAPIRRRFAGAYHRIGRVPGFPGESLGAGRLRAALGRQPARLPGGPHALRHDPFHARAFVEGHRRVLSRAASSRMNPDRLFFKIDFGKRGYTQKDVERWNALALPNALALLPPVDPPGLDLDAVHQGLQVRAWTHDGEAMLHWSRRDFRFSSLDPHRETAPLTAQPPAAFSFLGRACAERGAGKTKQYPGAPFPGNRGLQPPLRPLRTRSHYGSHRPPLQQATMPISAEDRSHPA